MVHRCIKLCIRLICLTGLYTLQTYSGIPDNQRPE